MRLHLPRVCFISCTLVLVAGSTRLSMNAADSGLPNSSGVRAPREPASPSADLLSRAASANQDLYASLQSFVCSELIERYKGRVGSAAVKHIDTVTLDVSFENGAEHYSDIRQKNHTIRDLTSLDGAWSEGEFGTLLQQSEQLLRTQPAVIDGQADLDGVPAVMLHFDVPAADSPWDLEVGGQHYFVPFRTRIWLSEASADILKISRSSTDVPAGLRIAQIDWSVSLSRVDLNGRHWLLPSTGDYQVLYRDGNRREWNSLKFSGYRRYSAEVKLHFE